MRDKYNNEVLKELQREQLQDELYGPKEGRAIRNLEKNGGREG
jgi:hypothetical protein